MPCGKPVHVSLKHIYRVNIPPSKNTERALKIKGRGHRNVTTSTVHYDTYSQQVTPISGQ